ncbi:hypothetical protein QYE76_044176 [Lolium multiflorum]|uniref:Transposase (putative) gypsy type domain-containing protein n=1 Tax=Lolium multiflorum TaxID=4521 RepID=A0AAD8WYV5_LOLMU|nr:hypothetical protein QYE76_044176 [Lolium multiflorum]
MAPPSGSWEGSYMKEDDIARLVRLRRILPGVITRAPGAEVEPSPEPGERVVFGAHFDRGLGLPASPFFRRFLDFFGLQPHHLPANACVLLSCYVAFMEGYAGLWPDVDFWSRLFYLKTQTTNGQLRVCGAASIYSRTGTPFPKIPTVDSVKKWQMSFFYVRNENPLFDRLNLPEYNPAPPVGRINWGHNAKSADPNAEVNLLWDFLLGCTTEGQLRAEDLLCRVLPLQARAHKIGHMSGRFDPTRTSRAELTKAQVARRLFVRQGVEDGDLSQKEWTADHVDPADQVGDDDLPEADDQGGQGEHNPPPSPEQQEEDEPASSAASPIRAVPLAARPPSTSATSSSALRGKKRASSGRSTAALEARAQKQRRLGPKKGCYQVCPGCRLWLGPCGGFGAAAAEEGADSAAAVTPTYAACCSAAFYGGGPFFSCTFARCLRLRRSWRAGAAWQPAHARPDVPTPRPARGPCSWSRQGSWRGCVSRSRSRRVCARGCYLGCELG